VTATARRPDPAATCSVSTTSRPPCATSGPATATGFTPPRAGRAPHRRRRLAGRPVRGKEAVLKLIGDADGVDLRDIEIRTTAGGRPAVRLSGRAAELAATARLGRIDISLSHTGDLALAVAAALTTAHDPPPEGHPMTDATPESAPVAVEATVRAVLAEHARLAVDVATLGDHDDLYAAGLSSHTSVTVMLACEDAYDVEFPQHLLTKATFASVAAIAAALTGLGVGSS